MKRQDKIIRYQKYAIRRMQQRGISKQQVERTVKDADSVKPAKRKRKKFDKLFSTKRRIIVIAQEFQTEIWITTAYYK